MHLTRVLSNIAPKSRAAVNSALPSITLFTRPKCSLCEEAAEQLSEVWEWSLSSQGQRVLGNNPLHCKTIDITEPAYKKWFDVYAYDVPVVHIQVQDKQTGQEKLVKMMHKIRSADVLRALEQIN